MILIIDCFKQVKGTGKSIGIYNLALNLVVNLVEEQKNTNNKKIKKSKIIVLGNKYNRSDFAIDGVEFVQVNYNPLNKLICILWELFIVSSVCKKLNADRVLFPRGFCALTHPVKDSIIIHDLIPFYYNKYYPEVFNKLENAYIMTRLKSSIKKCNQIITISEASKKDILNITKIDEKKIVVINNGCNALSYEIEKFNEEKYIVAITSGLPHKNAEGVIKSYVEYYKRTVNPLPLTVIGIADVEKYNLPVDVKKKITCFKFIKEDYELHKIIGNATVFYFLSLVEGFGFPPIEAMQLGVPVICSNLSSLPEVVGDAAEMVDPNDYETIGKALDDLINNKSKMETMIEKGYKNISRFSWENIAKLYWTALLQ